MNKGRKGMEGHTTASMFSKVSWDGRSTTRKLPDGSTRIYLHVFKRPEGGKLTVNGPVNRPVSASILGKSTPCDISGKEGAWTIQLTEGALDPISAVVVLTFKEDVHFSSR